MTVPLHTTEGLPSKVQVQCDWQTQDGDRCSHGARYEVRPRPANPDSYRVTESAAQTLLVCGIHRDKAESHIDSLSQG